MAWSDWQPAVVPQLPFQASKTQNPVSHPLPCLKYAATYTHTRSPVKSDKLGRHELCLHILLSAGRL